MNRHPSGPSGRDSLTVVCTLFEGDYHLGAAALVNSLVRNGFRGEVCAGFRGQPPPWAVGRGRASGAETVLDVGPDVTLRLIPVDDDLHFTWFKPTFMLEVADRMPGAVDNLAYLDPDIVVKAPWANVEPWFTPDGVSLVEDINDYLPPRHPKRLQWDTFFQPLGYTRMRDLDRYYNAGFVGVTKERLDFIETWRDLCHLVLTNHSTAGGLRSGGPEDLFESADQDALNYALMATSHLINSAGPEAMDFAPGGYYLSHAAGDHKPWRVGHLQRAVKGYPPRLTAKAYLSYADGPIRSLTPAQLARLRLDRRLAAALGRVYSRS